MTYLLTKSKDKVKKQKFGINLDIYPDIDNCGIVLVSTSEGHNQEFKDTTSTFTYLILEGSGVFVLDDEEVVVEVGDMLSIPPETRIYYKGNLKMVLITTPAWKPDQEVETKSSIW